MKRIDNLPLGQTEHGQLRVDPRALGEALKAAGFLAGDRISVVVTSDPKMAECEYEKGLLRPYVCEQVIPLLHHGSLGI